MSIRQTVSVDQADWRVAPTPAWVDPALPDWGFAPQDETDVVFLLSDQQHHVASQAVWLRTVRRLLSLDAVRALSQIEIEFDPAAYRLRIHRLAIWRRDGDGTWSSRSLTDCAEFLPRQREQYLERQILDGRVSLVTLLEDVRVGDALDLAWSLEPRDPLPGVRFAAYYDCWWTVPVANAVFTCHLDGAPPVAWRLHEVEGAATPDIVEEPEMLRFSMSSLAPTRAEQNVPAEHWQFPLIEVSAWTTWVDVAGFLARLWEDALTDDDGITESLTELQSVSGDRESTIERVIRFVQEEVRFLGVDFGHGAGMLPNGAGVVLRRRFGDCKDKSVLLSAMLRRLGIEAWPVLVSTVWQGAIARLHPSASCFDHAIVGFIVDGQLRLVDPTVIGQRGDIDHLVAPDYRCGLPVRAGATDLLTFPNRPPAALIVTETFTLDRRHQQGRVEQTLTADAWLADELRRVLMRDGEKDFFDDRFSELKELFPALQAPEQAPTVDDDAVRNRLELRATFPLPTWGPPGEKAPATFDYGAHGLFLAVERVDDSEQRRFPWALRHPMTARHHVVVEGRCVSRVKSEDLRFDGPAFRYGCEVESARRRVSVDYRWQTTADAVAAKEWPQYLAERERAFSQAGGLTVATGSGFSWQSILVWVGILAAVFFLKVAEVIFDRVGGKDDLSHGQVAALYETAREAQEAGDIFAAWSAIKRIDGHFEEDFDFQLMRGEIAVRSGEFDAAQDAAKRADSMKPGNVSVGLLNAQLLEAQGDFRSAAQTLRELSQSYPSDQAVRVQLARVTERLDDPAAKKRAWTSVLEHDPGHAEALFHLAQAAWVAGDRRHADTIIVDAIAALPTTSAGLESTLARYFSATDRHQKALVLARRAAELEPDDSVYAFKLVMALLSVGDHDVALSEAKAMTQRFPNSTNAWFALATSAAVAKHPDVAEPAFRRLIEISPDNGDIRASFGLFLHRSGRSIAGQAVLEGASSRFPGNGMVWLNLAEVLHDQGNTEKAIEAKRKADALLTREQRKTMLR